MIIKTENGFVNLSGNVKDLTPTKKHISDYYETIGTVTSVGGAFAKEQRENIENGNYAKRGGKFTSNIYKIGMA